MAGVTDLYPADHSDGDQTSPEKRVDPVIPPGSGLGTIYQPTPAPPAAKPPPPPPTLQTSYKTIGGTDKGEAVPYSGDLPSWVPGLGVRGENTSPEFPGVTPETLPQAATAAKGAISGDTSVLHPEIPALNLQDLGLSPADLKAWGIVGNMTLSRDPAALGRVIKERIPDATIDWDQKDDQGKPAPGASLTVQVPGGSKMYLDRPGITPQKALFYGPQTLAAIRSGGASLPAQMGFGGLQHALSQLGSWGLGGADKPFDPIGTAIATLAPGVLSAAGAGAVKSWDWLNSEASSSAEAIAARAKALYNWKFAGKEGDITQNPGALATEDLATNAGSDAARLHMQAFHDFNVAQNQTNKRQIIGNVSTDVAPGEIVPPTYQPNESAFGDRLNTAIATKAKTLEDAEDAAWARLGPLSPDTASGRSVTFSPNVSMHSMPQADNTIRKFYGAPQGPNGTFTDAQLGDTGQAAVNAYNQMRRVMQPTNADGSPGAFQEFNLGHLQDLRQQFANVIKDNPNTSAAAAATEMKRQLDDRIAVAEANGQMSGDPTALQNFRAANAATRAKYQFTEPQDNPAAERLITSVTNPAAPNTGQQTVNTVLGSGSTVTPGGGTSAIIPHLQLHLGDDATQPLGGALAMRSLYGNKGTSELSDTGRPLFDYNSTADRIGAQLTGQGRDVSTMLLPPEAQRTLASYREALDVLGTANRAGGPRLNAPGSGYVGMLTSELPFGIGGAVEKLRSSAAAQNATQTGAEIMQRANAGATTPGGLGIKLPRTSTLNNPANPFFSWQPGAWRAGTPIYRGGGLLLGEEGQPPGNRSVQP